MLDHFYHKSAFPHDYVVDHGKRLMKLADDKKYWQWAGVGGGRGQGGVNAESRVCRIAWIPRDDPFGAECQALIRHINDKKFGYKLFPQSGQTKDSLQLTLYSGQDGKAHGRDGDEAGGYYHRHFDTHTGDPMSPNSDIRKLSTTVCMSPLGDYEGGEFEIAHSTFGKRKTAPGEVICFNSLMQHEVHPVTKGNRLSLVIWMHGPDFV